MDESVACLRCQESLPPDAPEGLCPSCLLSLIDADGNSSGDGDVADVDDAVGPASRAGAPGALPQFPGVEVLGMVAHGTGGMGLVYKAREPSLDRLVAVKTINARLGTPEGRELFRREARAAAKLDHPNVLRIFRFDPDHAPPFFVMQLLEGHPLDVAVGARSGDWRFIAAVLEKVALALAYAHRQGVVHRDIKPQNILVDAVGEPHVADFGLAALLDDPESGMGDTASRPRLVGTPAFIPPEVYLGRQGATPAADVYALGVTMYQLLAGRLPFVGRTIDAVRDAALRAEPPLPQEVNPAVPEALQRISLKAMERDPEARYVSAAAMAEDLRRFRAGDAVTARPTRYQTEMKGRLQNHLTDIRAWHEQHLIDVREMDRLSRPYLAALEGGSAWSQLARSFPWEIVALRLGGWLVLLSSVAWPAFYWDQLDRWQRVLAVGLPALAMNLVGWLLLARHSRVNAIIYLSTGALLLPLATAVILAEYDLLDQRQAESRELFFHLGVSELAGRVSDADGPDDAPPPREPFMLTNRQITATAAAFVSYCLLLLHRTRANLLAIWLGVGLYLLASGVMLLGGLMRWLVDEDVSRAVLVYVGFSVLFWPVALALLRTTTPRFWAGTAYAFFLLPFCVLSDLLARFAAVEWLGADAEWDDETINRWLMANGALFALAALWSQRSRASFIRFWGVFLMLLVPLHLLGPMNLLIDKGGTLLELRQPVTTYEIAAALTALTLIVVGTRMRQPALTLPGLLGLAISVYQATTRHFSDQTSWPLALALAGGSAMAAALVSLLLRSHRRREAMI